MGDHTDYLLELFHSQVESKHYREADGLLKLLAPRLPPGRIEHLRAEIPVEQKTHHSLEPKQPAKEQQREMEIRDIVAEREIDYLVHFTQACNVASILKYGLIPRKQLRSKLGHGSTKVKANDEWRLDGHTDASSLSISFPNYRMFYLYRKQMVDAPWAVLLIDPKVLWEKDCAFCCCNAASRKMSTIPVEQLKSAPVFRALFEDYQDDNICVKRLQLCLANFHTTNPQAEVLVFDVIPADDIVAVRLPYYGDAFSEYRPGWRGVDVCVEPNYFGPRVDYRSWSKVDKEEI